MLNRQDFIRAAGVGGVVLSAGCLGSLSGEQEWPSRPVEIISPWSARGETGQTSRAVADATENHTDASWNVSNQTGGSGSVGINATASVELDGHTIGCTAPEIMLLEHLGIVDLSPSDITSIMQYTEFPATLVVSEDAEFSTLDKWISYGQDDTL